MISIIIPTYNEAKNIERMIKEISLILNKEDYEIIVADDNSPDGTSKIVKSLEKKIPVRLLLRLKDKGLANSVIAGFKFAKGDIYGVIDADFSHPPATLKDMIKKMEETNADMIVASRLVKGGGTEGWPKQRQVTSYLAGLLARPITFVKDPMSGYFILKKEVIENVELIPRGYKILLEILAKGKYKKVVEVPFIFKDRTAGESKLTMKVNLLYIRQLMHLYWYKLRKW